MKIVKINVSTDIEELMYHKRIIDDFWLENKIIKEKTTIEKFVEMLDMTKRIYIENNGNSVLPFVYIPVDNTLYFFYVSDNQELTNNCINDLKEIGFDLNKLSKITDEQVLNGLLEDKHYFYIDGQYYIK